ncbi:MAG TPA: hypothetical protein VFY06_05460 [Verrucomicrobiae bacterium]|nr:hypothetical protein [Verrucomicrobiae bacterium]
MKTWKPVGFFKTLSFVVALALGLATPPTLHANYIYSFVDLSGQGATGQLILSSSPTSDQTPLAGSIYTLNGITWDFSKQANSWHGSLEAIYGLFYDSSNSNLADFTQSSSSFTQSISVIIPQSLGDSGIWQAVPDAGSTAFLLFVSLTVLCVITRGIAGRGTRLAVIPVRSKKESETRPLNKPCCHRWDGR